MLYPVHFAWVGFELTTLVVISTDLFWSCCGYMNLQFRKSIYWLHRHLYMNFYFVSTRNSFSCKEMRARVPEELTSPVPLLWSVIKGRWCIVEGRWSFMKERWTVMKGIWSVMSERYPLWRKMVLYEGIMIHYDGKVVLYEENMTR